MKRFMPTSSGLGGIAEKVGTDERLRSRGLRVNREIARAVWGFRASLKVESRLKEQANVHRPGYPPR